MNPNISGPGGTGNIPGQIGPIGGDQKISKTSDQKLLEEVNSLPDKIVISEDSEKISSDASIHRENPPIHGDEELLRQMNEDSEFNAPLGSSAVIGLLDAIPKSSPEDELQIPIGEGNARIPLNSDENDIQIKVERQGKEDVIIQVDEEGKGLINEVKDRAKLAKEEDPNKKVPFRDRLHAALEEATNLLKEWIKQRMAR